MIKETCSCGAEFAISLTPLAESRERDAVSEWRRDHRHESQTVARDALKVQPETLSKVINVTTDPNVFHGEGTLTIFDPQAFTLNEDYVYNGNGEPVWIGNRVPPKDWAEWASHFTTSRPPVKSDSGPNTP